MDTHKAWIIEDGYTWKYGYEFMDIYFINEYQLQNVFAWISLLEYQCGYPNLHGQLKTDILKSWICILLSADFWKSMYGYAMYSRTRAFTISQIRGDLQGDLLFLPFRRGDVKIFYCDDDKMIEKPNFVVYGRIWLFFFWTQLHDARVP